MTQRFLGLVIAGAAGLGIAGFALPTAITTGWVIYARAVHPSICPWSRTFSLFSDTDELARLEAESRKALRTVARDEALDMIQVEALPGQRYWIQAKGALERTSHFRGFSWHLAEQAWIEENNPNEHVQKGDVVVDCGAHIGVFTDVALKRGASKVIAVEPDPSNIACLRKNFAREIEEGKVVVAPVGVWSSEGTMTLHLGPDGATGMNSMIADFKGKSIKVRVTPLDKLLSELGVPKVDFIKMDIEGAERDALRGSFETLRRDRPRLMLDFNHRPDDSDVLPRVIHEGNAAYQMVCGPCQMHESRPNELIPHVVYFR